MTKALGIGLFVALSTVCSTLYAGESVDCSKLSKYADGHTYHEGDLVWWKNGPAAGAEYRCKDILCSTKPWASGWEKAGECRIGSDPS